MNTNHNDVNEIKNATLRMVQNTDDYLWIRFEKCCGYSVIFPFLQDDSIQALYHHIDVMWKNSSLNLIWFVFNNQRIPICRGDNRTIRQFIRDHRIYREDFGIIYSVHFEVGINEDYVINSYNNYKYNRDNEKNIN